MATVLENCFYGTDEMRSAFNNTGCDRCQACISLSDHGPCVDKRTLIMNPHVHREFVKTEPPGQFIHYAIRGRCCAYCKPSQEEKSNPTED